MIMMMTKAGLNMSAGEATIKTCQGIKPKASSKMNPAGIVMKVVVSGDLIRKIGHHSMTGGQGVREKRTQEGDRIDKKRRSKP